MIGSEVLALADVTLADVARLAGGQLVGADVAVAHLRPLSADTIPDGTLTYATAPFVSEFTAKPFSAAIVPADSAIDGSSVVVHSDPARAFFTLHRALVAAGAYPVLETRRGERVDVARSAVVHPGTVVGDDVVIGDQAVIMPNTVLDDGVRVQAGAVIGEPGFQVSDDGETRFLVPHAGGVHLGRGVSVGANCTIDRAIFSTFTTLGPETMLDNLVHVAHDTVIGARCTLTAAVELSGSVVLEDDVWLAPRTCCNQFIRFGRGAYTGTGSVVVRDVDPFTLVVGSPARPVGRVCLCRAKLPAEIGRVDCERCGRSYDIDETGVVPR